MNSTSKIKHWMAHPPRCPLCYKTMRVAYDNIRKVTVLACDTDRVMIAVTDPLVGRWEKHEKIECPNCTSAMRIFFTSTGYMKAVCPKKSCGATVTGSNPDRLTMPAAAALRIDGASPEAVKEAGLDKPQGGA